MVYQDDNYFEIGLDHCVLYGSDGKGIVWNGVKSIEEDFGEDISVSSSVDGKKYTERPHIGPYAATLTAFTYPDEFDAYSGFGSVGNGLSVDEQPSKPFGLAYRTILGNRQSGMEFGHRIHLLYNLLAVMPDVDHETLDGGPVKIVDFKWKLTSTPPAIKGFLPSAHIYFDTHAMNPLILTRLEELIFGKAGQDPTQMPIQAFYDEMSTWGLINLTRHDDGTYTASSDYPGYISMIDDHTFQINHVNGYFYTNDDYYGDGYVISTTWTEPDY